jgi:hypothetical protein
MRRFFKSFTSSSDSGPVQTISGNNASDPMREKDVVNVKHTSKNFQFAFKKDGIANNEVTLGEVRRLVAEKTGVKAGKVKITCNGRRLEEDDKSLQQLGVEHNAWLVAVTPAAKTGGAAEIGDVAAEIAKKNLSPEQEKIQKIDTVLSRIEKELVPGVIDFITEKQMVRIRGVEKKWEDAFAILDEYLLQEQLSGLDGVYPKKTEKLARQKKRQATAFTQGHQTAMDFVRKLKKAATSAEVEEIAKDWDLGRRKAVMKEAVKVGMDDSTVEEGLKKSKWGRRVEREQKEALVADGMEGEDLREMVENRWEKEVDRGLFNVLGGTKDDKEIDGALKKLLKDPAGEQMLKEAIMKVLEDGEIDKAVKVARRDEEIRGQIEKYRVKLGNPGNQASL